MLTRATNKEDTKLTTADMDEDTIKVAETEQDEVVADMYEEGVMVVDTDEAADMYTLSATIVE